MCMNQTAELKNVWSKNLFNWNEKTEKYTIIVEDFNIPLSIIDRTTRQKIEF